MRILHILDHSIPLHSGYTFRTRAILREQAKLGWQTFHLTSPKHGYAAPDNSASVEQVDDLTFYRTPAPARWLEKIPIISQWQIVQALKKRLRQVIAKVQPDILHAHSPSLNGMAAAAIAEEFGLPMVYEVRAFWEDAAVDHGTSREGGVRYLLTRYSETRVLRQADAVTTICDGLRSEMIVRGIASDKITRIPNAVDIAAFSPADKADSDLQKNLQLSGKKVVGFIGSFYAYEGLDLLIAALPGLLQQVPDIRVLLVGGGPQQESLKQQATELGVANQVTFTGRVPHGDVSRYYSVVDVLVYPRLSMRLTETVTPLKPLEAMAQHKLVVASDVGGHKELIKDKETGYLFKAGDVHSLQTKLLELLQQSELWSELQANGRRFVETERNWQTSVANYKSVYNAVLRKKAIGRVTP